MRVITIKQPWAGAIFARGKCIENRSWFTAYRGPLLIHAGSRIDKSADIRVDDNDAWLCGHVLGVVELVDCKQGVPSKWADAGAWHWVLKAPRLLTKPIAHRGQLGLWHLPEPVLRRVRAQL